jgi:hypothetical protein
MEGSAFDAGAPQALVRTRSIIGSSGIAAIMPEPDGLPPANLLVGVIKRAALGTWC